MGKDASDADIKKAYRALAKKYHPDVNPGDKAAESSFKEVNEAYEVLSDQQKRQQYDSFGHSAFDGTAGAGQGFSGFEGFGGFDDILNNFFGGAFGGGATSRRTGPSRGADLRYNLEITFEEAAFGVEKEIEITRDEPCEDCSGSGAKKGTQPKVCVTCNGTGQVQKQINTLFGRSLTYATCDTCGGEGKTIDQPCDKCRGRGQVRRHRKIKVSFPAGIDSGQAVTLRGQGQPGKRGGSSGDLYVYVSVKPHKLFKRDNYNLYLDLPITFVQAALGADLEVPTLNGKVKYAMAEGTQTGTVFRLKGKGIKHLRTGGMGDLYVKVIIQTPKKLSEKQKELLKQYESTLEETSKKGIFDKVKDAIGGKE